ncbi:MAG: class I SAM-dependent methyltransferase [Planctomycetes bacterium]|nr:class I SAM-dependent methyltransferase [Planctomycetota bacterium]
MLPVEVVEPADPDLRHHLRTWVDRLDLPVATAVDARTPRLRFVEDRLTIEVSTDRGLLRHAVDFASERRHSRGPRRDQPLFRAIGPAPRLVVDATAGFGRDAFHLAQSGYRVTACEREPVIVAMLWDAQRRTEGDPELDALFAARLRFECADARHWLETLTWHVDRPDTIFVDPMFPPPRKERALPKKEIQILRALLTSPTVPQDRELAELIRVARGATRDRVVLKRPHHAPPPPGTRDRVRTKLIHYDVFGSDGQAPGQSTSAHSSP